MGRDFLFPAHRSSYPVRCTTVTLLSPFYHFQVCGISHVNSSLSIAQATSARPKLMTREQQ